MAEHWKAEENHNFRDDGHMSGHIVTFNPTPEPIKNADGSIRVGLIIPAFVITSYVGDPANAAQNIAAGLNLADAKDERIAELEAQLAAMEARKDGAYEERNRVVAALAKVFPSGICRTDIPGWSDDWHGCVRIDLPTGQVSWHFHDTHAHLFAELPAYAGEWDGHDTPEKYRRLAALAIPAEAAGMGGDRVWLDRHVAHRHAVELEQCSIFAADVGDAIAKAMTDAAADLRTAPAIFSAACNDPRNEADRLELIEQATRLLAKAKGQESGLRTPATVQFLTDVIATLTRWEAP